MDDGAARQEEGGGTTDDDRPICCNASKERSPACWVGVYVIGCCCWNVSKGQNRHSHWGTQTSIDANVSNFLEKTAIAQTRSGGRPRRRVFFFVFSGFGGRRKTWRSTVCVCVWGGPSNRHAAASSKRPDESFRHCALVPPTTQSTKSSASTVHSHLTVLNPESSGKEGAHHSVFLFLRRLSRETDRLLLYHVKKSARHLGEERPLA
jgi:hypothetical protein